MADTSRVYLTPSQAAALFQRMGAKSADVLVSAARASVQVLMGLAIREGFENQGPTYLNRDTGRAIGSIPPSVGWAASKTAVDAWYGSNLGYIRAHEEGFRGPVGVRPHVRRTKWGSAFVRAHQRTLNMRARRMFRDSFQRHQDVPVRALNAAVNHAVRTQQVPTPGQVTRLSGTG